MNLSQRIRRILFDGPATMSEVSTSLRITKRRAVVGLWVLTKNGHAERTGTVPNDGTKDHQLYALTPAGLNRYEKTRKKKR